MKSVLVSALGITMLMAASTVVQAKHGSDRSLPPGLQKKAQSGKPLPPGWEKKLQVGHRIPRDIYDYGEIVHHDPGRGIVTISVEGKLVRLIENTYEIVDILNHM